MNRDEAEGQGRDNNGGQRPDANNTNVRNSSGGSPGGGGDGDPSFWSFAKAFAFMGVLAVAFCIVAEVIEAVFRGPRLQVTNTKRNNSIKWRRWP